MTCGLMQRLLVQIDGVTNVVPLGKKEQNMASSAIYIAESAIFMLHLLLRTCTLRPCRL